MSDEPLVAAPGGLGAVSSWVEELFGSTPGSGLWTSLDDTLRLALAQGWILTVDGSRDDELAERLSHRYPESDRFDEMLGDLIDHWQRVYVVLDDGTGVLDQVNLVSVDMELVVLTAPEHIGSFSAGASIPCHSFITRLVDNRWVISALARRLPVPGWPPSERVVEGLL